MNTYSSKSAQGGFTLIELIVVIVILGILAATALPKFADLSGDARAASLKAAKGSLNSVAVMAHAKSLVSASPNAAVTMEGVTMTMRNGYPEATAKLAEAAGLSETDYVITADDAANTLTISARGAANAANCQIIYTEAASTTAAPTYSGTAQADLNCN